MAKALIAKKMKVRAEVAWKAVSQIGRLDVWFPSIATCRVEQAEGATYRYLSFRRGGDVVDHITEVSNQARRLTYDRVKSPFPVSSYIGTVEVFQSFDSLAVVVWTIDYVAEQENCDAVRATLEAGIGASLEGMKADLEQTEGSR